VAARRVPGTSGIRFNGPVKGPEAKGRRRNTYSREVSVGERSPDSALRVFAIELKSCDEASMRDAFVAHAFALNAKLSDRVSLLGDGEILIVTPAMLRK